VVLVPRLLEQTDDVGLLHVLDAVHPEQGGVAAVALNFLSQPLELLVPVARVGQEVRAAGGSMDAGEGSATGSASRATYVASVSLLLHAVKGEKPTAG
jgi:hypothetical protein